MPKDTKLYVFSHLGQAWAPSGQLTLTELGIELQASTFAYGTNYLKRSDALEVDPVSLRLNDRTGAVGKRNTPSNRLNFFGGIRDAAPDSWGRRVIEAKKKVGANSLPESEYLVLAGSERVGALDIRTSLSDGPVGGVSTVHDLDHLMEAADRIEEGAPVPAHLEAIFMDGTALGGARPKASVRDDQGALWMAKFSTSKDRFDIPMIECAALQLAAQIGLRVPPVKTTMLGDRRIMLIKRFDRFWAEPGAMPDRQDNLMDTVPGPGLVEHRIGFVSGLTMVACDESESQSKSYADLADAVRKYCHPDVIRADNEELFRRMVYNIFVTNNDDHLRNHGFVFDARLPGWRLSPLYDVLPQAVAARDRYLHLGVGPQGRLATLDNALAEHARFTLSRDKACELIDEIARAVRQWKYYFDGYGVTDSEMARIEPAFRKIDDISTEQLRKALR